MAFLKIHLHPLKTETIVPSLARQPMYSTLYYIYLRPIVLYSYVK